MWAVILNGLKMAAPSIIAWAFGKLFKKPDVQRDDDVNLGKATNELEHVKQDQADRAALDANKPVGGDDAIDRLRDHTG